MDDQLALTVVGMRKKVRSGQGLAMPVQAITARLKPDWVIAAALNNPSKSLELER